MHFLKTFAISSILILPSLDIVTEIFLAVQKEIELSKIVSPIIIRIFWAISVFNPDTGGESDSGGDCSVGSSRYLFTTRKIHLLGVILIKMELIILLNLPFAQVEERCT